jgi:subtilisin family serine protease
MSLKGNGQLLLKITNQPFSAIFAASPSVTIPGYALEPLSAAPATAAAFSLAAPADHWLLARPTAPATMAAAIPNPWDAAHEAARTMGYRYFVEPDILHEREISASHQAGVAASAEAEGGLNGDWPPKSADHVSPGWHLAAGYTGFETIRRTTTGQGVRIAHLDTGYSPTHASKPRRLRPDLGYDYWADKPDAVDPGTSFPGLNPGHGTATLALLAGARLDLSFGGQQFSGDFGGAPDAEVVPVRICPSVIHLYTSTMAKGLYHALAPGGDRANRCDVVSISHGGLPSPSWADAVNMLYENGVAIVAASGDSIYLALIDIATHFTVYPAAFNRVITALGATWTHQPYITDKIGTMQGCWGPDPVMEKAIAAYTPNVAWMDFEHPPNGFSMSGGGTSSSTPQIAAACALWLARHGNELPTGWQRIEACRAALFESARSRHADMPRLGWGMLNAADMLNDELAAKILADAKANKLEMSAVDRVSFPFWRLLVGSAPPNSAEEAMYEAEVAQIVTQSRDNTLLAASREAAAGGTFGAADVARLRTALMAQPISAALRARIAALPGPAAIP